MVLGLALLAGCGDSSPKAPLVAAPGLGDSLTQVDSSISQHRYEESRQQLDALVSRALAANRAGELTSAQTNRILAAAARLKSALPAPPPPKPKPQPKPQPKPKHASHAKHHAHAARKPRRHHGPGHDWRKKLARARHYVEHHHHSGGDEQ
jgi:hypothetical protein